MNKEKNCSTCKFCGWDPDGNYCAAPKVLETYRYGLNVPQLSDGATAPWHYGIKEYCEPDIFELYEERIIE